jgi:hypothetical protein
MVIVRSRSPLYIRSSLWIWSNRMVLMELYCTVYIWHQMYRVGGYWSLLTTYCRRYSTEDAVQIVNFFITILITRHYNHSQLSLTLLRVYTIIILTRSWLQSLITLVHIYTGWLLSYQLLSQIITHFPCLSPIETTLVGLPLTNWLVELLPEN